MAKFKIVVVSKDDRFGMTDGHLEDVNYVFVSNNSDNITKVYNRFLDEEKTNPSCDFLIFSHADVTFDVRHLVDHISECGGKYDIMGLCGCAKITVSERPLNWFCGSRPHPNDRWGCVTHGELGNRTSFFSSHSPDVTDHEVSCIDGLCIIFGRNAIDGDLRFDERLRFNCYDTQISFSCILEKKMHVGVLVEPSLHHYSVGRGILSDDFKIDERILRERFNLN